MSARDVEVGGVTVKVPTPEDLIIMKAVAQRPKDLNDIEALLHVHKGLDIGEGQVLGRRVCGGA